MIETTKPVAERILAAAGILAVGIGSVVVWFFDPTKVSFLPVCPLYSLTGIACPGCGLTRGFHALFHGDILTALGFNALIPLFGLFFGYLFISMLLVTVRGRGLPFHGYSPKILWAVFVMIGIFGVVRNIPLYPFSVLYP